MSALAAPGGPVFSPLVAERLPVTKRTYRLREPLIQQLGGNGRAITVPEGYVTDFASIPWWASWAFPPDGPWAPAAVVHDYCYTHAPIYQTALDAWLPESARRSQPMSRLVADRIFLRGLEALNGHEDIEISWAERTTMYRAVRLAGWVAWRRNRIRDGRW